MANTNQRGNTDRCHPFQPLVQFGPAPASRYVPYGYGDCFLLSQSFAAGDAGVEQVPLQHRVMLRHYWDYDHWIFGASTLERADRAIEALGSGQPFLIVYYGSDGAGGWQTLDRPLRTLTTLDRFGLVTWEGREPMLRMLQVDELRRAMGLPDDHLFEHGSRRDRIKMIGNGVCPPVMAAVIETITGG